MARGRRADSPGENKPSDATIKARLRSLIDGGVLPPTVPNGMRSSVCRTAHTCIACGVMIELGEPEYEWTNDAVVVLFFHRWCMKLYRDFQGFKRSPS
jgi:ribosomal protein L24E